MGEIIMINLANNKNKNGKKVRIQREDWSSGEIGDLVIKLRVRERERVEGV